MFLRGFGKHLEVILRAEDEIFWGQNEAKCHINLWCLKSLKSPVPGAQGSRTCHPSESHFWFWRIYLPVFNAPSCWQRLSEFDSPSLKRIGWSSRVCCNPISIRQDLGKSRGEDESLRKRQSRGWSPPPLERASSELRRALFWATGNQRKWMNAPKLDKPKCLSLGDLPNSKCNWENIPRNVFQACTTSLWSLQPNSLIPVNCKTPLCFEEWE